MRSVSLAFMLCLAGCGSLNTTFNPSYTPSLAASVTPSPPPVTLPPPALEADQARVERVLGMEEDRLWLTLSSRPADIAPQVLLTPKGMILPSVRARCPSERNLARALVGFLNEHLVRQVMVLKGMEVSESGVVADVTLDGRPLLERLQTEGLARPEGSSGWCP